MSIYEMAKRYYPLLWDDARLQTLVAAGRLTQGEYRQITGVEQTTGEEVKSDAP